MSEIRKEERYVQDPKFVLKKEKIIPRLKRSTSQDLRSKAFKLGLITARCRGDAATSLYKNTYGECPQASKQDIYSSPRSFELMDETDALTGSLARDFKSISHGVSQCVKEVDS